MTLGFPTRKAPSLGAIGAGCWRRAERAGCIDIQVMPVANGWYLRFRCSRPKVRSAPVLDQFSTSRPDLNTSLAPSLSGSQRRVVPKRLTTTRNISARPSSLAQGTFAGLRAVDVGAAVRPRAVGGHRPPKPHRRCRRPGHRIGATGAAGCSASMMTLPKVSVRLWKTRRRPEGRFRQFVARAMPRKCACGICFSLVSAPADDHLAARQSSRGRLEFSTATRPRTGRSGLEAGSFFFPVGNGRCRRRASRVAAC